MSTSRHTYDYNLVGLARLLVRDRLFMGLVAVGILLALPIGSPRLRSLVSDLYSDLIILPLVMAVVLVGLRQLDQRERRFWQLWCTGLGIWLAIKLSYVVAPLSWNGTLFDLTTDCGYMVFYLLLAIAAVLAPHRVEVVGLSHHIRRIQLIGATALVFSLLVYFAMIPGHLKPDLYASWLPSFDLYVALDLTLAVIYASLAFTCRNRRWATLYLLLGITCASWVAVDFLEGLAFANLVDLSTLGWPDLLWNLPLLFLAAAARGRHLLERQDNVESTLSRVMTRMRLGSAMLLTAVALPVLHLSMHALGLLDRDLQPARELLVLFTVAALSALAVAEYRLIARYVLDANRERKEAEKWAIERSAYLDALIEHSPLAIVSLDPDYNVRVCNAAFEELFGYQHHEIVGRRVLPLITPPEGREEAERIARDVLAGKRVTAKITRRHRDGRNIAVEVYGTPLSVDGRLVGILASYRDLRAQIHSEAARKASEQRLRRLTEAAFEGIAVIQGTRVTDANEQLEAMFGFGTGELVGSDLTQLLAPPQGALIDELLVSARHHPVEIACLRRNLSTFRAEFRARLTEAGGDGTCVLAVRDLTERLQLEAQLQQAQKMEAIGRLAGGIAHDFNNLLTVILGRSELLLDQIDPALRGGLEEIKHAGDLAASLTRQLLVFARKQKHRPEQLDLNTVTASAAENMLRRLIPENVELTLELAPEMAAIRADRSQIEQLVLNLALNAQDAMPDGGTLRIETAIEDLPDGLTGFGLEAPPGRYVKLTISDTGVGIAPDVLPRLFDPFFTTKDAGTGLGLATVYGIVRQSSGAIVVESEVGWGASFRVYLPAEESGGAVVIELPPTPLTAAPDRDGSQRREVLLVVEDVPEIGVMLSSFLVRQGYEVLHAVRPRQALAMADELEGPIDLLLTDVVMPEMSGPELARSVARSRPETKVLFVSGYAREELRKQIDEGDGAFLRKPFALADLSRMVRSLLTDSSAAA